MNDFNENKNPFESGSGDWKPYTPDENTEVGPQDTESAPYTQTESEPYTSSDGYNAPPVVPALPSTDGANGPDATQTNQQTAKAKVKSHWMATTSMILGIVGLVLSCCCCCCSPVVSYVASIVGCSVGIIFGILALVKHGKDGKAIAGIVMCAIAIVLSIISLVLYIVVTTIFNDIYNSVNGFFQEISDGCDMDFPESSPGDSTFGDGSGNI